MGAPAMTALCRPSPITTRDQQRFYPIGGASETVSQSARTYSFHHSSMPPLSPERILNSLRAQPWFKGVLERLNRFMSYDKNWNGYGEEAIGDRAVGRALVALYQVALGGPTPVVVPMSHGGIQIEWYYGSTEIEVDVPLSGPICVLIVHPDGTMKEESVNDLDDPIWGRLHSVIVGLQ